MSPTVGSISLTPNPSLVRNDRRGLLRIQKATHGAVSHRAHARPTGPFVVGQPPIQLPAPSCRSTAITPYLCNRAARCPMRAAWSRSSSNTTPASASRDWRDLPEFCSVVSGSGGASELENSLGENLACEGTQPGASLVENQRGPLAATVKLTGDQSATRFGAALAGSPNTGWPSVRPEFGATAPDIANDDDQLGEIWTSPLIRAPTLFVCGRPHPRIRGRAGRMGRRRERRTPGWGPHPNRLRFAYAASGGRSVSASRGSRMNLQIPRFDARMKSCSSRTQSLIGPSLISSRAREIPSPRR